MAKLIYALKYDFVVDLAPPLGQFLIDGCTNAEMVADVLCPVPLHAKRFRWRGFNQAELLANVVGQEVGLPVENLLKRIHFKKAQMELRKEERKANVEKAFRMRENVNVVGKTVVLVDDVATTLSTLEACASVLKEAGAQKVYGIVLARVY
ncbi:MAG: phosphoribosyltransferase family protein [Candidatus Gracilibacteria bacterium]